MSDFMQWLYAHYIRPQLDAAPLDGYEMPLSLLEGNGVLASNGRLHPALMDALNEQERYQWNCALLSHPGN